MNSVSRVRSFLEEETGSWVKNRRLKFSLYRLRRAGTQTRVDVVLPSLMGTGGGDEVFVCFSLGLVCEV